MKKIFGIFAMGALLSSIFLVSLGPARALAATGLTPISPLGIINERAPSFQWVSVAWADTYVLELSKGTTVVYTKTVGWEMCGPSTCGFPPTTPLTYGSYKWRLNARDHDSGVWTGYGPYGTFTIVNDPAIPIPQSPWGMVSSSKPTYIWTKVSGATQYQIQLTKNSTVVYTKTVPASACGTTTCSNTPTTALSAGSYQWDARAMVAGVWKKYSSTSAFSVFVGFDSEFASNASGWSKVNGSWSIGSGYFKTAGLPGMTISATHDNNDYLNFTYEVRMKRSGCVNCENSIYFNGDTSSINADGDWVSGGYRFSYTNDGLFSIAWAPYFLIQKWTPFAGLTTGWNTLKVTVSWDYAQFYINGTRVAYGTLPFLKTGKLGVGFFRDVPSTGNHLYVDWAKLSLIQPTLSAAGEGGIDISGQRFEFDQGYAGLHMAP